MKETLDIFDKGLAFGPPKDFLQEGYLRRARGMHNLSLGSFKTRPGSSLLHALNAHSIVYFADTYHYGVSTILYRELVSIKTGLSGDRLSFAKMPPTAGVVDYLFCAGGGDLFKVDSDGNVTAWGFAVPSDPSAAAVAGGALADGTYSYRVTYKNSTTGTRSNANTGDVTVVVAAPNSTARITLPGVSADSQVDQIEIWRSVPGGETHFYLDAVADATASYDDDGSTDLSSVELPTDNTPPDDDAIDCLGPHNASMFWLYSDAGTKGHVYYSPVGRAEAVQGYIVVCSNDVPLKKLFRMQSQLGVIGEGGIYIIGGENPYTPRQISGCPGTTIGGSVVVVPDIGMFYEASDGIRLFDGARSVLVNPGSVERIFRGESLGDLSSFTSVIGTFARDEYIISDTSQTIAYSITGKRWRDLGVGLNAVFYNEETAELAATISSEVLNFEDEDETDDNGTDISLSFEPRHVSFEQERTLQHITFDTNCASQQMTATLIHDGTETSIGTLQNTSRVRRTIPIGIAGFVFGVRLTGSISAQVEIFRIVLHFNDLDVELDNAG